MLLDSPEAKALLGERALDVLARLGASVVVPSEREYPAGLKDLKTPPPFLTFRGSLPAGGIALIGSRRPTADLEEFAYQLARALATTIVSGLAFGIDAAAHRGALGAGCQTIAYVGNGLSRIYPAAHEDLAATIVAAGGAVASEQLPQVPVNPAALVLRDRLQAAHASAVVLVASERSGGAMHTMRFAKTLGRPRFAFELGDGSTFDGNARAIADGARPLVRDLEGAVAQIHAVLSGNDDA